jgi:hypothetical protein
MIGDREANPAGLLVCLTGQGCVACQLHGGGSLAGHVDSCAWSQWYSYVCTEYETSPSEHRDAAHHQTTSDRWWMKPARG